MAGTKILNVQKNDSFDDVFGAFAASDASEVIFIFPKGTPFGKDAGYFEQIKAEADRTAKTVNVMTSDPLIVHLATQNGLGVLQNPAPRPRKTVPKTQATPIQPTQEETTIEQGIEPLYAPSAPAPIAQEAVATTNIENEMYAELAAARRIKPPPPARASMPVANVTPSGRKIRDIITSEDDKSVAISTEEDQDVEVEISRSATTPAPETPAPQPIPSPAPNISLNTNPAPAAAPPAASANAGAMPDIEKLWAEEELRQNPEGSTSIKKLGKFPRISKKMIFIPVFTAIIALGAILYFTVGSAKVLIKPRMEDLDLKLKVSASSQTESVQEEFNKIPGQAFKIQVEAKGSYELSTTKEVAQKASGKVVIYNKGAEPQRLVATTRLETTDGLLFRIPETITVPAASTTGGKTVPGQIESAVYADRPGKDYNIGPSKFTIPGLKDSPNYAAFSAISSESMTGGFVGTSKVVTDQDYTKAMTELASKAREEIGPAVKEQLGELTTIGDVKATIEAPVSNAKAGEAAEKLEMTVKATVDITAFREEDVHQVINNYLAKNGGLELVLKSADIAYENASVDAKTKALNFDVMVKGKGAAALDKDKILHDVLGMNKGAITQYFSGNSDVESARVVLSPFWVTSVPKNVAKVEVLIDSGQ